MKIKNIFKEEIEVRDYIINAIITDDAGVIENLKRTTDSSAKALANLITILHEKQLLTDEDVHKVLKDIW